MLQPTLEICVGVANRPADPQPVGATPGNAQTPELALGQTEMLGSFARGQEPVVDSFDHLRRRLLWF